ncbi:hypothetical protein QAD02_015244 [Eretmocerus hayati]|uniref:Uncharacterized protein n=1 Tax=Eretmocerus hayati TaxID=131215 RepID=A0ACC2P7Q3_9HYME|nr:hypothetical protein QAD02_015244 [Eretmocerus hayati]
MNTLLPNSVSTLFEDFVSVDDDVAVTGEMSDAELLESLGTSDVTPAGSDNEEDDDIDESVDQYVSRREVKDALNVIRSFFERVDENLDDVYPAIIKLESSAEKCVAQNSIQNKITDYSSEA